jgi:hypothetical protein
VTHPYHCSGCNAVIPLADVNVASDIALCRACGKTMAFSEIAPFPGAADIDLQLPPKGVRIEENPIHGRTIIYKKIPLVVLFLIPFAALWSGGSMFGIYGSQLKSGNFNLTKSLFGLPFLIGTIVLVSIILFCLFGSWRISFPGGLLEVVLKLGPIRWTRRHMYDPTSRVSIQESPNVRVNNAPQRLIQIETQGQKLKFGTAIPEEAKNFIAEVIRRTIRSNGI